MALDLYTGELTPAIGASGAVWGLMALYALLYPYEQIYIYFLFPIQIRYLALIYFLFDLHPVLLALSGDRMMRGVGHAAHVGGAVFGFLYYRNHWRVMNWISRFLPVDAPNSRRRPSRLQQVSEPTIPFPTTSKPEPKPWEAELDQVLDKIHREVILRSRISRIESKTVKHVLSEHGILLC